MKRVFALWLVFIPVAAFAQDPPKSALRVLYVGETTHPARTKSFETFLGARVAGVTATTHESFKREMADGADVVLLEWHQEQENAFPPKACPLGKREEWTKPTVLLGSAGLFVACIWQVNGGSG